MENANPTVACKDIIQAAVVQDVLGERDRQDEKWGAVHDRTVETPEDWIRYIGEYSRGEGRGAKYDYRGRLVISAALAIAALEAHDANAQNAPLESS